MEQFGLKGCHANYIMALCEEPGISQEQLAKRIYALMAAGGFYHELYQAQFESV